MRLIFFLFTISGLHCSTDDKADDKRLEARAARVTIIRDQWGVPHVYGKTDADAVFGLMYAQCEENLEKIERNYLQVLGRLSEIEGPSTIYQDLQMKLLYDTAAAIADYHRAPPWLKDLLDAFSDGIHFYLKKNPGVKPAVLSRFAPWLPLLFTDGAFIATKTAGISATDLENFYGNQARGQLQKIESGQLHGSNAFAIGPSKTAGGNAMLYINPHVSFHFRSEMHMVSEEGLNVYGAVTWGQFFVFQGFNSNCGWMHTSSATDVADLYSEKITRKGNDVFYTYDGQQRPVQKKTHVIGYKTGTGVEQRAILAYYTHHGPILAQIHGSWVSLKEQNRSMNSLIQSWMRMKATNLASFRKTMELRSNTSTNTMYADNQGNIVYWHGNFIPKRDQSYNWSRPVDGSTSATEWKGLHTLNETVQLENPKQGWLQNCNSTPFSVAGFHSIDAKQYPSYMAPEGENFRSVRAITEIEKQKNFTLDQLIALGYDHYLPIFDSLLPPLFFAYESLAAADPLRVEAGEAIALLRAWDKRSSVASVATTAGIFWAAQLLSSSSDGTGNQLQQVQDAIRRTSAKQKLEILVNVLTGLNRFYGSWKMPWGEINRYQRKNDREAFSDDQPSFPVGMASAYFGSLPSFETTWQKTKKQYGVAGNSFVAAVEFGKKIRAKSVITGGQSFDPGSKNYTDQAKMFIEGKFKEVLFYKEDVEQGAKRKYHPGEN